MAGTVIADRIEAASTSQLVIENGVALTPPTIVDVNNVQIGTFCRAWVSFNTITTTTIGASFNVSSITDNGTGNSTINFTNAMPDANYALAGFACRDTAGAGAMVITQGLGDTKTTASCQVRAVFNLTAFDLSVNTVSFFR